MSIESKTTGITSTIHRRLSGRWRRDLGVPVEGNDPPVSSAPEPPESQWYRGYSDEDLSVFEPFPPVPNQPRSGFIADFLEVWTRVAYATPFAQFDGQVFGTPVPVGDWFMPRRSSTSAC